MAPEAFWQGCHFFVKFIDKDMFDEYLNMNEYAKGIIRSLYEELGINANIYLGGKVSSFNDIKYWLYASSDNFATLFFLFFDIIYSLFVL